MNLKEKIQETRKQYPEYRTILGTVIGELDRITKTPTDEQVIVVLKKMVESNILCHNEKENEVLSLFLPRQLTISELKEIINSNDFDSIGSFMKFLKENYSGLYEGSLANRVFRDLKNL